jgi:putative transposase
MAKGKHSEAEIIGALKQLEAGRKAEDVGREMGTVSACSLRRNSKN